MKKSAARNASNSSRWKNSKDLHMRHTIEKLKLCAKLSKRLTMRSKRSSTACSKKNLSGRSSSATKSRWLKRLPNGRMKSVSASDYRWR